MLEAEASLEAVELPLLARPPPLELLAADGLTLSVAGPRTAMLRMILEGRIHWPAVVVLVGRFGAPPDPP